MTERPSDGRLAGATGWLRRLGIRSHHDLLISVVVLGYALAIFGLVVGALARDFGFISFADDRGRPVIMNLTLVTIVLSVIIFSLAILWLSFGLVSLRFEPKRIDPNAIEIHSPTVSVLVPAHNEQAVILELVQDLLAQDYPQVGLLFDAGGRAAGTHAVFVYRVRG